MSPSPATELEIGPDDGDCPNCNGEGFYSDCFEEYACADPEGGCDLCMRPCDWCRHKTPSPSSTARD
jgi:hypothetical protein